MDFRFTQGELPLIVSMPHAGTDVPDEIAARFTPEALALPDTDWHLPLLYGFLRELGVSTIAGRWSRYVIDLNRPSEDTNLYPGMDTTGLCPVDTFGRAPLYRPRAALAPEEVPVRLERYWRPYHQRLRDELDRLRARHARVVLWDAHSIASVVPRFFEGKLPDLNFGTAEGRSCPPSLADAIVGVARAHEAHSVVVNGRFKGGHITRHYGRPDAGVHAVQLEMCQSLYMDERPPFTYRPELAARIQPLLERLIEAALSWARA